MKKFIFLLFFSLVASVMSAQIDGEDEVYLSGDRIDAKFQGGSVNTFYDFVYDNFDKSKILKEGQLVCSFTVDEQGAIKNIRIVRDLGGESAFELIRVLRMAPKWQPATRGGKPIAVDFKMPFTFVSKKQQKPKNDDAQIDVVDNHGKSIEDAVYVAVEKQPEFPGGTKEFMNYFGKNFVSPLPLKDVKAVVSFIVNKDGSLSDVKMLRMAINNAKLQNEIIRVIANSPKWIPARQNGRIVNAQYTLPLIITIN